MIMDKILTQPEFAVRKRELLLDYDFYADEVADLNMRIPRVTKKLTDPEWLSEKDSAVIMRAANARADYSIDLLTYNYCAGVELTELRVFYPTALEYWESYAHYHKVWHDTEADARQKRIPHFALPSSEFWDVNRMLCFGILLGWSQLMPRLVTVVDYNNIQKDGLYERLLICLGFDRGTPPDECLRHLPYFKTLKIFAAPPEQRASLMAEYLADWYHASRREPYHDQHKHGENGGYNFRGYWSWEAAAITYLLDIDDSSYRDAQFYPADLVAFARAAQTAYVPAGTAPIADNELRARAGEPCPKAGQWQTVDTPPQNRVFQQGEAMANLNSAYGLTVWRFVES